MHRRGLILLSALVASVSWAAEQPEKAVSDYQAGMALKREGKLEVARDALWRAAHSGVDYADAYYALAWVQSALGDRAEAAASFLKVLAATPTTAQAKEAEAALGRLRPTLATTLLVFQSWDQAALDMAKARGFTTLSEEEARTRWQAAVGPWGQPAVAAYGGPNSGLVTATARVTFGVLGNVPDEKLLIQSPDGAQTKRVIDLKQHFLDNGCRSYGRLLPTPSGEVVAVTPEEILVFRPDTADQPRRAVSGLGGVQSIIRLAHNGRTLVIAGKRLQVWDLGELSQRWTADLAGPQPQAAAGTCWALAISGDSRWAATTTADGTTQHWDLASGTHQTIPAAPVPAASAMQWKRAVLAYDSTAGWLYSVLGSTTALRYRVGEHGLGDEPFESVGRLSSLEPSVGGGVVCGHWAEGPGMVFLQAWDEATGQAVAFPAQ